MVLTMTGTWLADGKVEDGSAGAKTYLVDQLFAEAASIPGPVQQTSTPEELTYWEKYT